MSLVALFLIMAVWGGLGFLLWIVAVAMQIWLSAFSTPAQVQRRIESAIHASAGVPVALGSIAAATAAPPVPAVPPTPAAQLAAPAAQLAAPVASSTGTAVAGQAAGGSGDIYAQIKKLAELKDAGVITTEEFDAKKTDLLKRI
jgi:hypothetical protein